MSRGWEQWGVSRTRLSWPMCWVLGAWFNMAKNVVLLCKVPVDKRCVLSWTVCDYLCWPYCAVFALIFNPCYRSYDVIRVVFDLRNQFRPAPPPAVPSTRGSSTSTSHRGRSDAHKLPTPGRPAGLTSQPNGHTTW